MTATTTHAWLRWTEKAVAHALAFHDNAEGRKPRREPYEVIDLAVKHGKYADCERGFMLTRAGKLDDCYVIELRSMRVIEEQAGLTFDQAFGMLTDSLEHTPADAAYMLAQVCEHGRGDWDGLTVERTSTADTGKFTAWFWDAA